MLFNSIEFAIFFPVVTGLYFLLPHVWRSWMLLLASTVFYMSFVPVYVLILLVTIVIDYYAGIQIEKSEGPARRRWLIFSVVATCLVLFVFKYFDFANHNLAAVARAIGWNYPLGALGILLPIGLSFHTFQSLSYVIEVYRGHQKAEGRFGIYALYVMFYPQLVAGPIERPQNLLHQFDVVHRFDYQRVTSGLRLMGWGLFKKMVIADRLAIYVNQVYGTPHEFTGLQLLVATLFFAYQIYCDFSGYSDMAIGAARVMGFTMMTNFDRPYSARTVGEFWRRWHISLSTWFKDYVYVSLGGNRVSDGRKYFNLFATFLLSGLWHGASWTYVVWGGLNGIYLVVGQATKDWRVGLRQRLHWREESWMVRFVQTASTFSLVLAGWVVFRATSLGDAWYILSHWFVNLRPGSISAGIDGFGRNDVLIALLAIGVLEGLQYARARWPLTTMFLAWPSYVRWPVYYALLLAVLFLGVYSKTQFIYFQF